MELADFFAIDRLSQHDEELLIESAMHLKREITKELEPISAME